MVVQPAAFSNQGTPQKINSEQSLETISHQLQRYKVLLIGYANPWVVLKNLMIYCTVPSIPSGWHIGPPLFLLI